MKRSSQTIRYSSIILAVLLFLPPIAIIPRIFGSMSLCGSPFCMRMLINIEGFSAMSKTLYMGLILLVTIFTISLLFGRYFCSHVCPVGGIGELVSRIVPKRLKINYTWIPSPAVRYSYLAAFLLLPLLGVGSICCNYCNFSIVSTLFGSIANPAYRVFLFTFSSIVNIILLVLLGFLAVGGRAYCNFLCPIGAIDALFNWLGSKIPFLKRVRIDESRCTGCNLCTDVCPVWAIETKKNNTTTINQLSCIPCNLCIKKCPEKAISFQKKQPGLK